MNQAFSLRRKSNLVQSIEGRNGFQASLPQDLIQNIVNELDDSSLRRCALASRHFVNPSRRRIFKSVVLNEDRLDRASQSPIRVVKRMEDLVDKRIAKPPTAAQRLAEVLETAPELGGFVEEFTIEGSAIFSTHRVWYDELKAPLHRILSQLSNLKSLSMLCYQHNSIPFFVLPDSSSSAIIRTLHSHKLTRLVVENVSFGGIETLFHFLKHSTAGGGLKELILSTWTNDHELMWLDDESWRVIPFPVRGTSTINSLHIYGPPIHTGNILEWLKKPEESYLDLHSLTSFEVVGTVNEECHHVFDIIQHNQEIQHFGFTESPLSFSIPQSPALSGGAHALRYLTFYALIHDGLELFLNPRTSAGWWIDLFTHNSFPNLVEFRVESRGHYGHLPLSDRITVAFNIPCSIWSALELAVYGAAPNARFRVDMAVVGFGRDVPQWKNINFPDDDVDHLSECFPLAHLGEMDLAVYLSVLIRSAHDRRSWLGRLWLKPKYILDEGAFLYTPEGGWSRVEDPVPFAVKGRSTFEFH